MTQFNWDDSRVFLALAREGTLSGAARVLKTGVATVSRRIERLEHAFGLPLFLRHQSGYTLSDQGEALLARAEAVECEILKMRREVDGNQQIRGRVQLATVESLIHPFILPALKPLLLANPGLDVDILYSTQTVNLHRHDADLALRMVQPDRGHLRVRRLATMGFGLYGPPTLGTPNTRGSPNTPEHRIITWRDDSTSTLNNWLNAFYSKQTPHLAINTFYGQIDAVKCGIGVTILPHFMARAAGLNLINDRLPDGSLMTREIFLVTHADLARSLRVSSVAEAVADAIVSRRSELE